MSSSSISELLNERKRKFEQERKLLEEAQRRFDNAVVEYESNLAKAQQDLQIEKEKLPLIEEEAIRERYLELDKEYQAKRAKVAEECKAESAKRSISLDLAFTNNTKRLEKELQRKITDGASPLSEDATVKHVASPQRKSRTHHLFFQECDDIDENEKSETADEDEDGLNPFSQNAGIEPTLTPMQNLGKQMKKDKLVAGSSNQSSAEHVDDDMDGHDEDSDDEQPHQNANFPRLGNSKPKSSRFRGVSVNGQKWVAQITINKRKKYLGYFDSEVEAAKAYDRAAKELRGAQAKQNFPSDG